MGNYLASKTVTNNIQDSDKIIIAYQVVGDIFTSDKKIEIPVLDLEKSVIEIDQDSINFLRKYIKVSSFDSIYI